MDNKCYLIQIIEFNEQSIKIVGKSEY